VVAGYDGTYRGVVGGGGHPLQEPPRHVLVPEVYGDVAVWAVASLPAGPAPALPTVGETVQISFERGDSDYPIWEPAGAPDSSAKYRGMIVDNDDPLGAGRVLVVVPEVDPSPAWAAPGGGDDEPPEIGTTVWIDYDNGDPAYPRWVGRA
jgi:hypothetical protein